MDECYFQPWSSCSHADAQQHTVGVQAQSCAEFQGEAQVVQCSLDDVQRMDGQRVPPQFNGLLKASGIKSEHWYFWWRSQGAAFFVRPNARTASQLDARRAQLLIGGHSIQPGTISVYVRHGKSHPSPCEWEVMSFDW